MKKIRELVDSGVCATYVDAYIMCVDMGEIRESASILAACGRLDSIQ